MINITTSDLMMVAGSFGLKMDYSVRFNLKLRDEINSEILHHAVEKTQKRYPYLSLRMFKNETDYYYESNPLPVVIHNTDSRVSLNTAESNYHIWSVSYIGDRLYLDISHGVTDGTAMYMVLATMLFYYCSERYGITDSIGIRTLEDEITPDETIDPYDLVPMLDSSKMPAVGLEPAFSLAEDTNLKPCEPLVCDIELPEKEFVDFCFANEASPGTMVCVLFARAIDSLYPQRARDIRNSYIVNARPMFGSKTHHNCVQTIRFAYLDNISELPLNKQCAAHRSITAEQSAPEYVHGAAAVSSSRIKMVKQMAPTVEAKKQAYAKMLDGGKRLFTYMVSYIGQWKQTQLSPYVLELWTHVPNANNLLTEIAAINGKIFLSVHCNFVEDDVIKAFLRQLDDNGIAYSIKSTEKVDNAYLPEPETK